MLKLNYSVMCGYLDRYITENSYDCDISFLANEEYHKRLSPNIPYLNEMEIYDKYASDPEQLVRDYDLSAALVNVTSAVMALKYFPEVKSKTSSPIVFPELFKVSNLKLVYSEEDTVPDTLSKLVEEELYEMLEELFPYDTKREPKEEDKPSTPDDDVDIKA